MSTDTEILRTVVDHWKAAVDAHDVQPIGMTAHYDIRETKRLADDLILGYLTVDFSFLDRPTVSVYLSLIIRSTPEGWLITHYQVSRLS